MKHVVVLGLLSGMVVLVNVWDAHLTIRLTRVPSLVEGNPFARWVLSIGAPSFIFLKILVSLPPA